MIDITFQIDCPPKILILMLPSYVFHSLSVQCDSILSWINNYPTLVYLCSRRIILCIVSNTFSFPFLRLNFKIQFSPFYVTYEWLYIPPPFLLLFMCTKYVSRYDKNEVWLLLYIFIFYRCAWHSRDRRKQWQSSLLVNWMLSCMPQLFFVFDSIRLIEVYVV